MEKKTHQTNIWCEGKTVYELAIDWSFQDGRARYLDESNSIKLGHVIRYMRYTH